jgi:hypothetical protein
MLISLRIPNGLLNAIDLEARADGRSRNSFIVHILRGTIYAGLDEEGSRRSSEFGSTSGERRRYPATDGSRRSERDSTYPIEQVPDALLCDAPREKPNIEDLRAICRGDLGSTNIITTPIEIPMCLVDWWEDGEHYECLMDKGHKILKHGQRGMVRRVDE